MIPVIPVVDADARVAAGDFARFGSGTTGGFGDVFVLPAINWTTGSHHIQFGVWISVPVGRYSRDRVVNLGRNYWAYDPQITYTFLDPASGFDLSTTAGVLINERNRDSNYRSGTAVHIDATVAKHFASGIAIGLTGYAYQQVEDDEGFVPTFLPPGFRGSAAGLGPAFSATIPSANGALVVTAKWLHDIEATNRLRGDTFMLSLAAKL